MKRVDGVDNVFVEGDQYLAGIGLIQGAGIRFEAPERITHEGRFEDVHVGGYDPDEHIRDMELDGVAGEVLYPSQGLFLFKVKDPELLSAIFRGLQRLVGRFLCHQPRSPEGYRHGERGTMFRTGSPSWNGPPKRGLWAP